MQIIYLFVPFQTEANFNSFTNYFNNLTTRHGGYDFNSIIIHNILYSRITYTELNRPIN